MFPKEITFAVVSLWTLAGQLSESTILILPLLPHHSLVCPTSIFANRTRKIRACFAPFFPFLNANAW